MNPRSLLLAVLVSGLIPAVGLAAEEKKKPAGGFVPIDTLTATVIASNGRPEVMTVQCGIDAPDPALHTLADLVQPRLRDAYNSVLQSYAAGLAPGAPPDPDYIARRMQQATDRVLGKPGGRWLIGGVMVN
jgi:hypothetical protein